MTFHTQVVWTGNLGQGTSAYRAYSRNHKISAEGKGQTIAGASDPKFLGDPSRYSPEELLVAALSACHMLSYLHLCADAGIVVSSYRDEAVGEMKGGSFDEVTLRPRIVLANPERSAEALELHEEAHRRCFIANSVNFPVRSEASIAESEKRA